METIFRAPIDTSFELSTDGIITSPAWLAWFNRTLTPAVQTLLGGQNSPDVALELGKPYPRQSDGSGATLPLANRQAVYPTSGFPPSHPSVISSGDGLAMLASSQPGRQQPVWLIADTTANRSKYPNSAYPVSALFIETDRLVIYRNTGAAWAYLDGTYSDVLANIPTLGGNDAGFLFSVTDYAHLLRWSGAAWGWGPGESGSGYFQDFAVAPTANGWHACDGSAGIAYLQATGATGTVTLPNTAGSAAYRKSGAAYAPGITAPVAPTVTPTGIVSQPTFTGSAEAITTVDVVVAGAQLVVATIGGSNSSVTPSGTVSQPTFTGALDTVNLPGDPNANYQAITYFRQ